ncbi:MAG TPA: hypothetical protein VJH90_02685 [archaeon]|nr:hypothetical protein [archaeon]
MPHSNLLMAIVAIIVISLIVYMIVNLVQKPADNLGKEKVFQDSCLKWKAVRCVLTDDAKNDMKDACADRLGKPGQDPSGSDWQLCVQQCCGPI